MADSGRAAPRTWTARRVRASGSSILLAIAVVVAVLLGRGLFEAASQPLGWVAAAAAVSLVLAPIIELQARKIPRGVAIAVTLIVGVAAVASVGAGLLVEVQDQLGQLREQLPAAAEQLEETADDDGILAQLELSALVQDLVEEISERASPQPTIEEAVGTVPAFLVSGVLVMFFLVWGGSMFDGLERQISDPDRRERISRGMRLSARLTQRYIVAALAVALVVALVGGTLSWLIGLPTPLVLGVVVGVASIIPYVGVLFGSVPILLLSAASEPFTTTVALGLGLIGTQAAVTLVTRRVIEQHTLRVGPAVIVITALLGSDLYGVGGALVAMFAGVLTVAAVEAWSREQATAATLLDR